MIIKAVKKPIEVEAILWDGTNKESIRDFVGIPYFYIGPNGKRIEVLNNGKWNIVEIGEYIIKGINGEFYPINPDTFLATYDVKP